MNEKAIKQLTIAILAASATPDDLNSVQNLEINDGKGYSLTDLRILWAKKMMTKIALCETF